MELVDYLTALRRFWRTWVGVVLVGVVLAGVTFGVTPRSYQATARIFVSVLPTIPNGAQFVEARVQSYPAVITSATVLAPVIDDLGLHESVSALAGAVSVNVPAGTAQLDISVADRDPRSAAAIANAVAQGTTQELQQLETPASGVRPVSLTVTDPASVPASPASPRLGYYLAVGVLAGLFLGLAAAVARSRASRVLHDEKDVRRAWGAEPAIEVLGRPHGRARRATPIGDPSAVLSRRLELLGLERPTRIVLLCPSPSGTPAVAALARTVAAQLGDDGMDVAVTEAGGANGSEERGGPRVLLTVADVLSPSRFWRAVADGYDGAVLVVPSGQVSSAEFRETRALLGAAGVTTLAVLLTPRRRRRRADPAGAAATGSATSAGDEHVPGTGPRPAGAPVPAGPGVRYPNTPGEAVAARPATSSS